ncbi:MAG: Diaminobutyrate--2-oxoglutarate transaminase [Myxococcota bacterium]|nr:Diaminobutyrate--2-oxoglutarate transaminase [Myxococcota bacterium]
MSKQNLTIHEALHPPPAGGPTADFEQHESNVRSYCRSFPAVFVKGKGSLLTAEDGKQYIDFFAGAGALNYGHNPDFIKERLIRHLEEDGLTHALDMYTAAKREFIHEFVHTILQPRELDYRIQFCGPTGANAVETALKLARLVKKRPTIGSFTGGWHGMSAGCLAVTGNRENRASAGIALANSVFFPYPAGPTHVPNTLEYMDAIFSDANSGLDLPAAIILETVQGEGGIYVAPPEFLRGLRELCTRHGVLLIVDDIQAGCGRTGDFFSFERAGVTPDIVCLSKSIGGYGLPMSLVLMKRDLDIWKPGEHTGTFRGNQLAFIAAKAAIERYWSSSAFTREILRKGGLVERTLRQRIAPLHTGIEVRGLGLMWGMDFARAGGPAVAKEISRRCFQRGLIVERCGRDDTVIKLLPPLTIEDAVLNQGLQILHDAVREVAAEPRTEIAAGGAATPWNSFRLRAARR